MELTSLKGCGPKTAEHLKAADIHSVEDFTTLIPRRYDVRHLETEVSLSAGYYPAVILTKPTIFAIRRNLRRLQFKADIFGETITLSLFNQIHWLKHLAPGVEIVVYGVFNHPMTAQKCYLKKSFKAGIMPIYAIKKVADPKVQQFVLEAIRHIELKEDLPTFMVDKYHLTPYHLGLIKRHQPEDLEDLIPVELREKVTFLFSRQLEQIHRIQQGLKIQKKVSIAEIETEIKSLPFELTASQQEVISTLLKDLNAASPIRHLLQGDTGSGKTIVAFLVALTLLKKGDQVALMAPTEILASQHFKTFKSLFNGVPVVFLTGSMSPVDTQIALDQIKSQKGTMIIGTHALFSNKTLYQNLTLVIIDEQHRFGVAQRQKLLDKGPAVDFISLSATPIPRTLALTLYQGMAVSVLSEKPKGRQPVTTSLMPLKEAKACDAQIEETLTQNKQVFIIAPRIEEDEQLLSVERIEKYYKDRFKKARIRTLHGQQESLLKEKTLTAFAEGEVDILIATTVVEVGIDIKRATLMLVYHAERFGLAQLHQLRGRLGRHLDAGECILLYRGKTDVKQRLHLLKTIDDGFTLSQKDLETRGFGTLFGLQQSGFSQMQTWPYEETLRLMESIKEDVQSFLKLSKTAQEKVPLYTKLFKTA
jgi:ATP-dependent DNA helicase RecG